MISVFLSTCEFLFSVTLVSNHKAKIWILVFKVMFLTLRCEVCKYAFRSWSLKIFFHIRDFSRLRNTTLTWRPNWMKKGNGFKHYGRIMNYCRADDNNSGSYWRCNTYDYLNTLWLSEFIQIPVFKAHYDVLSKNDYLHLANE